MTGGLLYVLLFAAWCVLGLPLGLALFGRKHAAGWITGALLGYGLVAIVHWGIVQLGLAGGPVYAVVFGTASLLVWRPFRHNTAPWIVLPVWTRRDTLALLLVLLLVPVLQWRPFTRLGEVDASGARRYRAYFTADFLWHVALTSELAKETSPPRNPYLARRPLHYYWAYFVPPAHVVRWLPLQADTKSLLLVNAFCAGLLFVAAIFILAWCVVPRAGPVAVAVACVVLAASAEGAYALWDFWSRGRPLSGVRELNIDAITAWWFQTLTIDSLPRSLWYTPQHAMACAFSLVALLLPVRGGTNVRYAAPLVAGLALGLALIFSPFLGGAFALIFGVAAAWTSLQARSVLLLIHYALAAVPVIAALGWCLAAGTFEGSGGAVALGLSRTASAAPLALVGLALGPVLVVAILALIMGAWRHWPLATPIIATVTGFFMLYFVTLTLEPIWIGWRAGQIILVTLPALLAAAFALVWDRRRVLAVAVAVLVLAIGLPTTIIDAYNAQDVSNTKEAAGFRWTVVVPPDTQSVLDWIRINTARDAVVQMSIGPRRRETWTLVPTFAERRMAAGRPISLLHTPEYDDLSNAVDAIYQAPDPIQAHNGARMLRIDYLFVDTVERSAFGEGAMAKFDDPCCFQRRFAVGQAAVYAVK